MKHQHPTVVVLESNDTYMHQAYCDAEIYTFSDNCLLRGLPERNKSKVLNRFDHGAMVLNRIVGKDIGMAPQARIIYVSSSSAGRGSLDRLKKLNSLLHYTQKNKIRIDAISISDTVSHSWRPDLLLNEAVAKQFGVLTRTVLTVGKDDTEMQALFDHLNQARMKVSHKNAYLLQDLMEKETQTALCDLYQYVLDSQPNQYEDIVHALTILKDISLKRENTELTHEIRKTLLNEQGAQELWQKIQEISQKQGIAIFSVETCLDQKIGLHGMNARGEVYCDAEDERLHAQCNSENMFLFYNGSLDVPNSYQGQDVYSHISRGGLSSLVPAMAGMFARGREIKPELTMFDFLRFLKSSASEKRTSANGSYTGYVVNPQNFDKVVSFAQNVYHLMKNKHSYS